MCRQPTLNDDVWWCLFSLVQSSSSIHLLGPTLGGTPWGLLFCSPVPSWDRQPTMQWPANLWQARLMRGGKCWKVPNRWYLLGMDILIYFALFCDMDHQTASYQHSVLVTCVVPGKWPWGMVWLALMILQLLMGFGAISPQHLQLDQASWGLLISVKFGCKNFKDPGKVWEISR